MRGRALGLAVLGLVAGLLPFTDKPLSHAGDVAALTTVRVGLPETMFRDVPQSALPILAAPLTQMLESQTGLQGRCLVAGCAEELGRQLEAGKLQLGVFSGIEFAWVHQQRPGLVPLVIAVNKCRLQRAYVICRKDAKAAGFADFKGKKLAVPYFTREHCHVALECYCKRHGGKASKEFFAEVSRPVNLERALDDVVWGRADITVVDGVALEWYKKQKPGCHTWLKVVQESEDFPAGVIVYSPTVVDKETAERIRSALIRAPETAQGKELLSTLRLTGFERVPADYDQELAAIAKAFPPPERPK
jgi:ABC-type phosphate/phosphonate transport system substrate-binding protein